MKRLFVNIILFFVAVFLLSTIGVFGLVYGLYYSIRHYTKAQFIKYWADVVYLINVGIDQIGNVMLAHFLTEFFLIDKGLIDKELINEVRRFGKITETISYVLAINYFAGNLTKFGLSIVAILEFIDPGHMEDSL